MCAIKKHIVEKIGLILVILAGISHSYGQKNPDIIRLENKLDSILILLQKDTDKKKPVEMDCTADLAEKEKMHQQQIQKMQAELEQQSRQIEQLKKEKELSQKNESEAKAQLQKSISTLLTRTMQSGSFIKQDALDSLLSLARKQNVTNIKEFENYIRVSKEVIQLNEEFIKLSNYDSLLTKAWELHSKSYSYAGLHNDVKSTIFKLKNYCDYEQKLVDAIELSQTQASEENRKKQLIRREDDFNDYPSLRAEIEKIKSNKSHTLTKKCKS